MTYLEEVRETIKNHPELPKYVVEDVEKRINDWMQGEFATEWDAYLEAQNRYLNRIIENGNTTNKIK